MVAVSRVWSKAHGCGPCIQTPRVQIPSATQTTPRTIMTKKKEDLDEMSPLDEEWFKKARRGPILQHPPNYIRVNIFLDKPTLDEYSRIISKIGGESLDLFLNKALKKKVIELKKKLKTASSLKKIVYLKNIPTKRVEHK